MKLKKWFLTTCLFTKESGLKGKNTAMDSWFGQVESTMKANFKTTTLKGMGKCLSLNSMNMKVNGVTPFSMDMDNLKPKNSTMKDYSSKANLMAWV